MILIERTGADIAGDKQRAEGAFFFFFFFFFIFSFFFFFFFSSGIGGVRRTGWERCINDQASAAVTGSEGPASASPSEMSRAVGRASGNRQPGRRHARVTLTRPVGRLQPGLARPPAGGPRPVTAMIG